DFRPVTAPEKIGKKATRTARATMARSGWSMPDQISTRGAMATTGVTCSTEASGRTARSSTGLRLMARARAWATRLAITTAARAGESVFQAGVTRPGASAMRAWATAEGAGRK